MQGDWPNTWLYIHGPTHHKTVNEGREAHQKLPIAETLSAILFKLDNQNAYPQKQLGEAWFNAIYPDHGWGGNNGAITDSLFHYRFETANKIATNIIDKSLKRLYSSIDFKTEGIPVLVYNPSSFRRTSQVVCDVDFEGFADVVNKKVMNFELVDFEGNSIPYQNLAGSQYQDGKKIVFVAKSVPPTGYQTFYLKEIATKKKQDLNIASENKFYMLVFANGGIKEIFDKELGINLLNSDKFLAGELFTMQSIGTGAGEFSHVQQPDMTGFESSSKINSSWNCTENGPVKTVWETTSLMAYNNYRIRVALHHQQKRVDFEYDLLGFDGTQYREFRCAFPLSLNNAAIKYHSPMAISEVRKTELEGIAGRAHSRLLYDEELKNIHPREVLNWFAASDEKNTVLISTDVSVFDWIDPTENPVNYTVLQPVMLASRRSCNGKGNWYLQPGDHSFKYSLTSGKTADMDLMRTDLETNRELFAVADINQRTTENKSLPETLSFFEIDDPGVLVSTIKKAEDNNDLIVRVFDYSGKTHEVELKSHFKSNHLFSTDMLERNPKEVVSKSFNIKPFSIETYLVK